jgi:hypothetical protein
MNWNKIKEAMTNTSGKAVVLAVYIAGKDGEDYISVLRGVYSKRLITMMARDLENW